MGHLGRTRLSPDALTFTGVTVCAAAAVVVYFEYKAELLCFWLGAALFVVGSVLDILDGALARSSGKGTVFGAFLDSTTDRIGEAFMLGAIALVFSPRRERGRARLRLRGRRRLLPRQLHDEREPKLWA